MFHDKLSVKRTKRRMDFIASSSLFALNGSKPSAQLRTRSARDPVFSFHVKSVFECAVSLGAHLITQRAPVTLCLHFFFFFYIIFNMLIGKCWQYFARSQMRLVCKPVFTEAGVFRHNKSSTAVSAKIKVHKFISCKQGLKLTEANKWNIVQAEQAHCLFGWKISILRWGFIWIYFWRQLT